MLAGGVTFNSSTKTKKKSKADLHSLELADTTTSIEEGIPGRKLKIKVIKEAV